jgi:hypothetical protein
MKKHFALFLTVSAAILFVYLFYKQDIGLNLFVFEIVVTGALIFLLKRKPVQLVSKIVLAGTLLSGISVVVNYSILAIFINLCSFFLFTGTLVYPEARSILTPAALAISNSFQSIRLFILSINELKGNNKGIRWILGFIKIALIPILVIAVFILLYNSSNPIFSNGLLKITDFINSHLNGILEKLDFEMFFFFLFGLFICIFTFYQVRNKFVISYETNESDQLTRNRKRFGFGGFKATSLKNELKSAIFLLISLNLLILIINAIDIYWVWFNFEWNGEYLKQFVHEGTYMLIFSILISMAIVLFFFRGNLNFYSKNRILKFLSYAWLAQNAILAVSVAIRNFWYIKYFSLAYGRIGVLFFLILTLYGIYTVIVKVRHKKSTFYLLRSNNLAIYCMLIFMTFFNWDVIIARYNFRHYQTSFVHLDFLSSLSYKALPYLDKDLEELHRIQIIQNNLFPFEEKFMTPETYYKAIQEKKELFLTNFRKKNLHSWNFAEHRTYKKLIFHKSK